MDMFQEVLSYMVFMAACILSPLAAVLALCIVRAITLIVASIIDNINEWKRIRRTP
jgi:hypothetical protein